MKLKSLQSQYIQKSRIFLYPLLGIKRGVSITPIQTHMTWDSKYSVEDFKLIGRYYLRDDAEFRSFEQSKLLGNPYFDNFFELEDGTGVYVFDFSIYAEDYKKIVNGKYSKLSLEVKTKILTFFQNHHSHHDSIMSYFEPEDYFTDYAKLLGDGITRSLLRSVGELCSRPDLNQENLSVNEKIINFDATVNNLTNTKES